jgi:DNA-binding MarR family transcriptional regulator
VAEAKHVAERSPFNAALTMIVQARVVEERVETELKSLGLSMRRLGLLGHLRAAPGISFSELARRAGIKVQSLHPIVDVLLEQGLVTTVGGVGQGRAAVIELTPRGAEAADRAKHALTKLDDELFADGAWKDLGDALRGFAQARRRELRHNDPSDTP